MAARTWLAVILSCAVLFVYTKYFTPPPIKQTYVENAPAGQQPPAAAVTSATSATVPRLENLSDSDKVKVSQSKWNLEFSKKGAQIWSLTMKGYRETAKKDALPISIVDPNQNEGLLSAFFTDEALKPFDTMPYQAEIKGTTAHFKAENAEFSVDKAYSWSESDYFIDETIVVTPKKNLGKNVGYLNLPLGTRKLDSDLQVPLKSWEIVYYQNDSLKREYLEKISEEEKVFQGNTPWAAFGNRYFTSVVLNQSTINPDVVLQKRSDFTGGTLRFPVVFRESEKSLEYKFKFYVGPKDTTALAFAPGIKGIIDYGMFSSIGYPLLETLRFFYRYVKNYGIAIILLTILVRLLFYPLSVKSYQSMKRMQALQPQIQALKEKYADDKERLNREQLTLFKTHKVNPAGGCLPLFIQMPVFIALWAVLSNSIELFQAPFFGWIHDLSSKDPFYVFPVLMGASMVIQQKLTPTAGLDPMQAKMMMFMPLVFSIFMLNLPSGLTIYMFVSTLLGILQQWYLTRGSKSPSPVPTTPLKQVKG